MKKINKLALTLLFGSALTMSSCSDFMDITPTTEYTEDAVFSDPSLTQAFVNQIYSYVQHGAMEHTTTGLTDDGYFTHNYGQIAINEANVSQSDLQWYGDYKNCPFRWQDRYKGIRYANSVINNIDKVPEKTGFDLKAMKGEAFAFPVSCTFIAIKSVFTF